MSALTREEWALGLEGMNVAIPVEPGWHEIEWDKAEIDAAEAAFRLLRAFQAGLTWADVDECRLIAREDYDRGARVSHFDSLADRIEALLPPREGV